MFGSDIANSPFSRNVSEFHTERLLGLIEDAEKCGGEVIVGGTEDGSVKEKYFPPTLVHMGAAADLVGGGGKAKVLSEEVRRARDQRVTRGQ